MLFDFAAVDRPELALPSMEEVVSAFRDLSPSDVAMLAGAGIWLLILAVKLKNIDRRDMMAGCVYMLFCCAAGIALLLAAPKRLRETTDAFDWLLLMAALSAIAALRWFRRGKTEVRVVTVTERPSSAQGIIHSPDK